MCDDCCIFTAKFTADYQNVLLIICLPFGVAGKRGKKVKSKADEVPNVKSGKSGVDDKPFASIFAKANSTTSTTKKSQARLEPKKEDAKSKKSKTESMKESDETSDARNGTNTSARKKSASKKETNVTVGKNGQSIYCCGLFVGTCAFYPFGASMYFTVPNKRRVIHSAI
jgi:hypothetical protein